MFVHRSHALPGTCRALALDGIRIVRDGDKQHPHRSAAKRKSPPLRMSFSLVGGGGGNWPSSPANAPACALAFAGSQQCCSNSLLTPRPFRTWFQSPHQLHMQQIKMATLTGSHFYLLVEAGGIEPPSASPLQAVLHT